MRHYQCECTECGTIRQILFSCEPYPELGEAFLFDCSCCHEQTQPVRSLTRKAVAELRRKQQEADLRASIVAKCEEYGFQHRFLYQSVIITTDLADWCFDYHEKRITLYRESTVKINLETGDYAKSHVQFCNRKITPMDVIDYIHRHDTWKASQQTK